MSKDDKVKLPIKRVISNNLFLLKMAHKAAPGLIIIEIALTAILALLEFLSNAYMLRYTINKIAQGKSFGYLALLVVLLFSIKIVINIIEGYYHDFVQPVMNQNVERHVQKMLYKKAIEVELSCYENPSFYDKYVKAIGEGSKNVNELISSMCNTVSLFILFTTNTFLIFLIDGWLLVFAIFPLIFSFLNVVNNKNFYKKNMAEYEESRRREYIRRVFYLGDYAKEIRLTDINRPMFMKFAESAKVMYKLTKDYGIRAITIDYILYFVRQVIGNLGTTTYAIYRTTGGFMQLGDCIVVINSVSNVTYTLQYSAESILQYHNLALYTENIRAFLDYKPKVSKNEAGISAKRGDIEFKNVSFTYEGAEKPVLRNINIKIGQNEKIALVGQNGAGKSILVKLLLHLYEPNEGEIYLDGKNIKGYNLESYRSSFGVVLQDIKCFSLSIAENILLRPREEDDEELVLDALNKSGLYERVMKTKHGIDTVLTREFDDDGEIFSGGEAQKLAIASVFAKNNSCVILDEPSSALDPIAEYEMYENMSRACENSSMLFISHRLSSAVNADRIYMLEDGEICEVGTHEELMKKGGKYAEMFLCQAENYRKEEVSCI